LLLNHTLLYFRKLHSKFDPAKALLTCIRKVLRSNLGRVTGYHEDFRGFSVSPGEFSGNSMKYPMIAHTVLNHKKAIINLNLILTKRSFVFPVTDT
jgi:hypothetical protein